MRAQRTTRTEFGSKGKSRNHHIYYWEESPLHRKTSPNANRNSITPFHFYYVDNFHHNHHCLIRIIMGISHQIHISKVIVVIISNFFCPSRKTSFLTSGKRGPSCPNLGLGYIIRAMAESKTFFFE